MQSIAKSSGQSNSSYGELATATREVVDQVLDPEDVLEPVRWPGTMGQSAIYKSKQVFNAKFSNWGPGGDTNNSCVLVYPRLSNAVFVTSGASSGYTIPTMNSPSNPYSAKQIYLPTNAYSAVAYSYDAPIYFSPVDVIVPFPSARDGLIYPINNVSFNASMQFNFTFPQAVQTQLSVTMRFYNSTMNQVTVVTANTTSAGLVTIVPTVLAAAIYFFSIQINSNSIPWEGYVSLYLSDSGALVFNLPPAATHMTVYDLNSAAALIPNINQAIVVAQSMLCTFEGATLSNGGVIAAARLPGDTQIGITNNASNTWDGIYNYLASLPYHNYDGPVKTGAYAWYLGDDERDYFYNPAGQLFNLDKPYLVSFFTTDDTTDANVVRIKVVTIVQFTTGNTVYSQSPSPYAADNALMHYMLSNIPGAFSNAGHMDGLRGALRKAGAGVSKVVSDPRFKKYASSAIGMISKMLLTGLMV